MLAILLLGLLLLFSFLWLTLYVVSRRSRNPDHSTGLVLQIIVFISILVLLVQDYILKESPSNSIIIVVLIITLIIISSFSDQSKSAADENT